MGESTPATPIPDLQLFRDVFHASPIGIAVEDFDGQPLFTNPAFCSFLGFSEEELRNKHCVDFSPLEDAQKDWALFQRLRAGSIDHYQLEKRYFRKDGSLVWGRLSISLFNSRPSPLVLAMVEDITDKKRAEEKLHESEERLRLAVQAGRMFAYSWNAATDVIERSGESAEILGIKNDQAATGAAVSEMVYPDDKQRLETELAKLTVENPTLQITYRITRPDGAVVWLERNSRAHFDDHGKIKRIVGMILDVTERQHAEETLRESETRFRFVADAAPVMIWMSGTDKLCTYFNKPWLDFTGRTSEEEIGNGWVDGVHKDDAHRCFETYTHSFDRRESFEMEYRLQRHDGEYRWILDIGVPRYGRDGSFAGYIGSCIDVTERRRAEEARFRHAAILESSEDAIISKNLAAVITSWNAGAERMFGYTESEAVGQPITILIPPELHEEEDQILDKLRAGGRIEHYETTRATKTGKPIAVSLTISPIKDSTGKVVGFCKLAHDITDRKRAEQALQETNRSLEIQTSALRSQEELLKIFVKNVPAAVAMLDRDMRYVQVSDRWCTDYLPGRAQILGRSHYEIFPDLPERWKEVHRRALQGETLRADEDSWDGRDGTHWARWEVRPWKTREGAVGGILILAEDISRRKQMEEALSGMSRKLIESQEQERARIGRELHDDINQRLAMLAVELEQLQENPSEVSNRVQGVRKEITEISNDVQALSHELHSSKLEYLGVVAGIKSWCKEFSERQRMEVNVENEVFSTLPFEVGLSLFRVIQEALHNAQKHSGVKRIEVQLREDSGEIHLIIRDSGKGFDIDAALQGRGLGLTSMRERVRLVNGTIAIESKPMGGTSIHVRVPLESKNSSQRAAG